ncbi:MAG: 3-dehydroquinate synthase II [Promethearchaeota archaeon]
MVMKRIVIDPGDPAAGTGFEEVVQAAVNQGIRSFFCGHLEGVKRLLKLDGVSVHVPVGPGPEGKAVLDEFRGDTSVTWVLVNPGGDWGERIAGLGLTRAEVGAWVDVSRKEEEQRAVELAKAGASFVVVNATDWKVIPVENLISAYQNLDGELLVKVNSPEEAELMFHTLEVGVDGVVFVPRDASDVLEVCRAVTKGARVSLTVGEVVEVVDVPSSDRVCVDTTSLLRAGEGLLVGGTALGFVLVHAEVFETEFVASRPFRVNAGDVSAYVLVPGDDPDDPSAYRTQYLSELRAGAKVVVVDVEGRARVVTVGRVKIETRPMKLLRVVARTTRVDGEGTVGGEASLEVPIHAILQNAETIRVVREDGSPISVTKVTPGTSLLVRLGPGATHFGTTIRETILEK